MKLSSPTKPVNLTPWLDMPLSETV